VTAVPRGGRGLLNTMFLNSGKEGNAWPVVGRRLWLKRREEKGR